MKKLEELYDLLEEANLSAKEHGEYVELVDSLRDASIKDLPVMRDKKELVDSVEYYIEIEDAWVGGSYYDSRIEGFWIPGGRGPVYWDQMGFYIEAEKVQDALYHARCLKEEAV